MICVPLKNQKTLLKDIQEAEKIADLQRFASTLFQKILILIKFSKKPKSPSSTNVLIIKTWKKFLPSNRIISIWTLPLKAK